MNKKEMENIYRMSQEELKSWVTSELQMKYKTVIVGDGFVFAQGTFPVMLVAHMDTVHKELVKEIIYSSNGNIISSPQGIGGDDRNGVIMILEVIKRYDCSVLFCEDEEVGCVGSGKFAETDLAKQLEFNYIIEFDRANSCDAVFYNCANDDFEEFITKDFYETQYGSFTDICEIAPVIGCAAVNLSCGYYKPHTTNEFVNIKEMERSIEEACEILGRTTESDKFEYIEDMRSYNGYNNLYYYGDYGDYDDVEEDYWIIEYWDKNGNTDWEDMYAFSKEEAVGKFLMAHSDMTYNDIMGTYVEKGGEK